MINKVKEKNDLLKLANVNKIFTRHTVHLNKNHGLLSSADF
jgi:hypothetical protein